jgi:hypothetical protein
LRHAAKIFVGGKTFGDLHTAGVLLGVAARKDRNGSGLAPIQDWFADPGAMERLAAAAPAPTGVARVGPDGVTRVLATNAMAAVGSDTVASDWLWDLLPDVRAALGRLGNAVVSAAGGGAAFAPVAVAGVVAGLYFIPTPTGGVVSGDLPGGGRYKWDGAAGWLLLTTGAGDHLAARLEAGGLFATSEGDPIGRLVDQCVVIDQELLKRAVAAGILYNKKEKKRDRKPRDEDDDGEERNNKKKGGKRFQIPRGFWPGDKGAMEWGRRHGIDPYEAKKRLHDLKGDDPGSEATDVYGVNPDTGEVIDRNNEYISSLSDVRSKGWHQ